MTQCWSEGSLRAYLDGELPTEDMQQVAAHLGNCTACDTRCTELAGRAAHVSALMDLLPEWSGPVARPAKWRMTRANWAGVAAAVTAALAACLALAAYLAPQHTPPEVVGLSARPPVIQPVIQPGIQPGPADVAATFPAVAPPLAPTGRPAPRRVRRVRQTTPEPAYFVALDDEPFESGVIMRVDVKPGNVQADIVFGPDGRAHAFRLVNASKRNF